MPRARAHARFYADDCENSGCETGEEKSRAYIWMTPRHLGITSVGARALRALVRPCFPALQPPGSACEIIPERLSQHYAGDQERVSKETGVSVGTIRKYLSLLALPPELQERLSTTERPAKIEALHALTRIFPNQREMAEVYEQIGGSSRTSRWPF
mgnify:CR=1 FL=1